MFLFSSFDDCLWSKLKCFEFPCSARQSYLTMKMNFKVFVLFFFKRNFELQTVIRGHSWNGTIDCTISPLLGNQNSVPLPHHLDFFCKERISLLHLSYTAGCPDLLVDSTEVAQTCNLKCSAAWKKSPSSSDIHPGFCWDNSLCLSSNLGNHAASFAASWPGSPYNWWIFSHFVVTRGRRCSTSCRIASVPFH